MVDWAALQACLKGLTKVKLLLYCKLMHGILNTNEQNYTYYGKPSPCPHCKIHLESFTHVVSCPSPEVSAYRIQQQEILWKSLKSLQTPQIILQYIQKGVTLGVLDSTCDHSVQDSNDDSSSDAAYRDFSIAAFNEQSLQLGWEHFLRGRVSKRWKEAFHQEFLSRNSWANSSQWSRGVIDAILTNSLSLWRFRCALLYGQTKIEADRKIMEDLSRKVTQAYREYKQNPFIVWNDYRHLFNIPLNRRLLQDRDCLQCFMATFEIAKDERVKYTRLQSDNAKQFFFPRSLPNLVNPSGHLDSSHSSLTSLTGLSSNSSIPSSNCSSDSSSVSMVSLEDDSQSLISSSKSNEYRVVDL
jgi:hypothetical protein